MTKQLSPKQRVILIEAIELMKQAQSRLERMNALVDEIAEEESGNHFGK